MVRREHSSRPFKGAIDMMKTGVLLFALSCILPASAANGQYRTPSAFEGVEFKLVLADFLRSVGVNVDRGIAPDFTATGLPAGLELKTGAIEGKPDWGTAGRHIVQVSSDSLREEVKIEIPIRLRDTTWGFVIGGSVASQQASSFSQADPFLGFTLGYRMSVRPKFDFYLATQGIFTADARTAMAPEVDSAEGGQNDGPNGNADGLGTGNMDNAETMFENFLSSRQSFNFNAQFWLEGRISRSWGAGPYFSIGGSTVLDRNELEGEAVNLDPSNTSGESRTLDTSRVLTDNDIKMYYEAGLINRFYDSERKLLAHVILAFGDYEALQGLSLGGSESTCPSNICDNRDRFIGKLNVFPFGLGKTRTFMFGVDVNAGRGDDQVRFFIGFSQPFSP